MTMQHSHKPVVRFAPSPNGYLHLGHAYSALANQRFARRHGGRFLLRIEDIDTGRARPEFVQAIFEDLHWLGVEWEEPVRFQSHHMDDYRDALDRLAACDFLYPCWCTRKDVRHAAEACPDWPSDPDGSPIYPGTCRDMPADARRRRLQQGQAHALRLDMRRALRALEEPLTWREFGERAGERRVDGRPERWGDAILARKDVATSYHLAVVVDDALQGVTDVIRGEDLFAATGLHRLLQALLKLPAPNYRHHRLLRDDDDAKLAKSAGTKPLRDYRREGAGAREILALAGDGQERPDGCG